MPFPLPTISPESPRKARLIKLKISRTIRKPRLLAMNPEVGQGINLLQIEFNQYYSFIWRFYAAESNDLNTIFSRIRPFFFFLETKSYPADLENENEKKMILSVTGNKVLLSILTAAWQKMKMGDQMCNRSPLVVIVVLRQRAEGGAFIIFCHKMRKGSMTGLARGSVSVMVSEISSDC